MEEVLKVCAFCLADPGDQGETVNNGLNKRRTVGEGGDGEEVDEVFPDLMEPRDADREAGGTT